MTQDDITELYLQMRNMRNAIRWLAGTLRDVSRSAQAGDDYIEKNTSRIIEEILNHE